MASPGDMVLVKPVARSSSREATRPHLLAGEAGGQQEEGLGPSCPVQMGPGLKSGHPELTLWDLHGWWAGQPAPSSLGTSSFPKQQGSCSPCPAQTAQECPPPCLVASAALLPASPTSALGPRGQGSSHWQGKMGS